MKKILSLVCAFAFIVLLAVGATNSKHSSNALKATPALGFLGMAVRRSKIYDKLSADFPGHIITPSYIRAEAYLVNGAQSYAFPLTQLGTESATEHKLNQQDAFNVSEIGIFLLAESTQVGGIGVLQTYPNAIVFPDEAGFLQNAHLEHIYNGTLTAKVGDTNYLPDLPIQGCRVVNTTEQAAGFSKSEKHQGDGFMELTPQLLLRGREFNELTLKVPGNSAQKVESQFGTTNYKPKVVLVLAGFKITGAGNQVNK